MISVETGLEVRPSPIPLTLRSDAEGAVDRAIRRGELRRIARGAYAVAHDWARLRPWQRYLARVHAVALTHPGAVFAAESAAVLWGVPILAAQESVHLLAEETGLSRAVGGIRTRASGDARDVRSSGGLLLLAPDEAAVDIARTRHPGVAMMAADGALRLMPERRADDLLALNDARSNSRGRARARWSLGRATPLGETALESVSRAVVEWLGFAPPVLQRAWEGPNGEDWRTDMFWPDENVIGEADGRVKYDGTHGDGGTALIEEKRREDALRRRVDGFARWMWPEAEAYPRLRDALVAAGVREVRPPRVAPLITLRAALAAARERSASETAELRRDLRRG